MEIGIRFNISYSKSKSHTEEEKKTLLVSFIYSGLYNLVNSFYKNNLI